MALSGDIRPGRGTRVNPAGWRRAGKAVPVVLLLAALFLAHGLQCAVAAEHGPGVPSHHVDALAPGHGSLPHGIAGDAVGVAAGLLPLLAHRVDPRGDSGSPGHAAGVICVAVLIAAGTFLLWAGRYKSSGGQKLRHLANGYSSRLGALARWWPPSAGMAVLCVSRT